MATKDIATDVVHTVPEDLRKALMQTPAARAVWEDITPLARNGWICWVISGKKAETRGYPYREGTLEAQRRNAPPLLLGWLHPPLK